MAREADFMKTSCSPRETSRMLKEQHIVTWIHQLSPCVGKEQDSWTVTVMFKQVRWKDTFGKNTAGNHFYSLNRSSGRVKVIFLCREARQCPGAEGGTRNHESTASLNTV